MAYVQHGNRWLEGAGEETFQSVAFAVHAALRADHLPVIAHLTRSAQGKQGLLMNTYFVSQQDTDPELSQMSTPAYKYGFKYCACLHACMSACLH